MEHSQEIVERVTGHFFAAEPLLKEAEEMMDVSFADLDDGKDRTKLLISALVATLFLFAITAAGTIWFINKNISEKKESNSLYTYQMNETEHEDLNTVSMLDVK